MDNMLTICQRFFKKTQQNIILTAVIESATEESPVLYHWFSIICSSSDIFTQSARNYFVKNDGAIV